MRCEHVHKRPAVLEACIKDREGNAKYYANTETVLSRYLYKLNHRSEEARKREYMQISK
jgi:hypothetical protein